MQSFSKPVKPNPPAGFTLIELLVTIAILGVVAVILIPAVRTLNQDRKVRDTARIVGSAFAQARERAAVDGRAGVEIWPINNSLSDPSDPNNFNIPDMGMLIYQLRAIPPWLGDLGDDLATVTVAGLLGTALVPATSDLSANGANVSPDDFIELNHSGVLYRITSVTLPSTVVFAIGPHDPQPPQTDLPFKVYRQPVRIESSVVRLPNNLFLNLAWSGHGNTGSQFGLAGGLLPDPTDLEVDVPVRVWFNRDGSVDKVTDRGPPATMVNPVGPLFLLLATGQDDDIDVTTLGDQGFIEDDNNLWIVIDHRNGSVSIGRMGEHLNAATVAGRLDNTRSEARNRRSANP